MVFSSALFLVVFLPIVLLLYWVTPAKAKNTLALLASLIFYAWGAPRFVPILLASILLDYFLVRHMDRTPDKDRRKLIVTISVLLSIGLLIYFKYFNFVSENLGFTISEIALPIGISFFTFQKISYAVDVYREKLRPFEHLQDYALYITFFPQLIAGPIVRYGEIKKQIEHFRNRISINNITAGFFRFCIGLSKKVLIADQMGDVTDQIFATPTEGLSMGLAWLGSLTYAFQIYFDFSGYTDMALGLGLMMGFRLPENFRYPYISRSFTEFWRRWHITLSEWMRDYLYIPLGGNRVSELRLYLNLWIVFIISGFWHGAAWNFVVWGIYHGFFLVIERLFKIKLGTPLTFALVLVGWVFFRADDLGSAFSYIGMMVNVASLDSLFSIPEIVSSRHLTVFFVSITLCFLPLVKKLREWLNRNLFLVKPTDNFQFFKTVLAGILFIFCLSEVFYGDLETFIYFRF